MGWSFHGKKKDVDAEKHLRRLHKTTPFIESPLAGADQENLVFSQRHEASTIELFFDLFFVANLATFTAYHSISDLDYLLAYIGFFGILWATWFQITLHDVRFSRDSIYERVCKTVQFISFVGLALVGSSFNPTGDKTNNKNFSILCYVLVISRGLLAVQYSVVLFYTKRAHYSKLYLPLGLMIGTYAIATAIFGGMIPLYRANVKAPPALYMVWYGVMIAEAIVVITISCCWRMLSFKKTHLMERMSLLTIIVIGEGAIGVTKTVGRIMGKGGLNVEGCFSIMCIIVILVFIWALYFDNFPHGHYGTIRQQIWSLLHFPFQLAVVGVVEGAQQIVMARYVLKNVTKGTLDLHKICHENLDGAQLRDALIAFIGYFKFDKKLETYDYYNDIMASIESIGNATGICSQQNEASYHSSGIWPEDFQYIDNAIHNGVYAGLGVKIPIDKLKALYEPIDIAEKSWWLTYMYFWACFCALILSLIIFLFLIRRHKVDIFDVVSVIIRCLVLAAGGAALCVLMSKQRLVDLLNSPAILPMAVVLMFVILCCDKLASLWCNWRLIKSGKPYALEYDEEHHHHGGHDEHGEVHMAEDEEHGNIHHGRPELKSHRKSAGWGSDTKELSQEVTDYSPDRYRDSTHEDDSARPLQSSSPPLTHPKMDSSGYMPVAH
ncbi:bacterial low temperature requirement A protein-domain-containing protein [Boeremia exigua]|uniref:bacterial low temperature requirement A protein-domain-containing protein n=1 Tax=Boeremia exigua TaxID=749465 RepID=UPI001E8DC1C2|nr:bacterial low temperature requirement A protein-domain-containing protein [Boeremia exigua]KAH6618710.1 bacterial low temperature requirement A protein-domain-containing protein [Boeremia exigua]